MFDIVEISSGFISVPHEDLVRLTERVQASVLKAKPEVGIQFGAGGASRPETLEAEAIGDPEQAIQLARKPRRASIFAGRMTAII